MARWTIGMMVVGIAFVSGCESGGGATATVSIRNGFGEMPPWTICHANYRDVEFGKIAIGATSGPQKVEAGLDYVLVVAAWKDPDCKPEHCLPIASKNEEEVVDGQTRTIEVAMANHQGPCPPEGVPPIPQKQYERILALYPEYGFKPYADRATNPQCVK
ncbi:MAG: hypothetical protein FJ087_14780 [Deltaproteobacteria bacterium]|nr:hypothetical protein [Deltaproteobacteria bacterium]